MKEIFVDELSKYYDFKGKNLLDVGANCAYWSSWYVKMGAKSLVALEGREKFIEQAKLYYYTNNILPVEKTKFICGDVASQSTWANIDKDSKFDFCLCCGILYHIIRHDLVLENICSYSPEAIFIDTRVSEIGEKHASEFEEVGDYKFDAIPTSRKAKHPTLDYLMRFYDDHGYRVTRLACPSTLPQDNTMQGKDNFVSGRRVALLGIRK
jgi:hypothetical protein